ncbi:MAG: DUF58 domain-containing protein [Methanoculleus sp.]
MNGAGADLIRQIRRIELRTAALADGSCAGPYRSPLRGSGMALANLREYIPGDDARAIDWKASARLDRLFVREYEEERSQTYYLILDRSGSAAFGSSISKDRRILEVAASLIFAAHRQNGRIGLCIVTDQVERFIPARPGRSQVIRLVQALVTYRSTGTGTDLAAAFRFLCTRVRRRCSVIVLSDFDDPGFARDLAHLRRRHETTAIRVTDPAEDCLPDVGPVILEDPETGEQVLVDTSDPTFRRAYADAVAEADRRIEGALRSCRVPEVRVSTEEPYDLPLRRLYAHPRYRGG